MAQKKAGALMRLDKFLTEMGRATRSEAKELARRGRIAVNGAVVKKADEKIDPERDEVAVDGRPVAYARMEYYMLNKPQGTVSATEDGRYPTVVSLIDAAVRRDLFPVGRLDLDTEGLLLITNDGALAHRLLAPNRHVDKVYLAHVAGKLPRDAGERMAEGLTLEDGTRTRPARLEILGAVEQPKDEALQDAAGQPESADSRETVGEPESEALAVKLKIHEGKFHQVKRMFEALGCRVVYLKRLSMGPLVLDESLAPGEYRALTETELAALLESVPGGGN